MKRETNGQLQEVAEIRKTINTISDIINTKDNFLLTTHIRSDPDGISSELALFYLLIGMKKKVTIINDSQFPDSLHFLIGKSGHTVSSITPEFIRNSIYDASKYPPNGITDFEVVIALDTPNIARLGETYKTIPKDATVINIDHHISNEYFGEINWVLPQACSTGEMIYDFFKETEQKITPAIATSLYTSIITDTGRFVHANTTPKCLRTASELIELGANPSEIAKHLYQTVSFSELKLQALTINSIRLEAEGKISVLWLTKNMINEAGAAKDIDTQIFTDTPLSIENVEVGVMLKEFEDNNEIKVSLRSKNSIDVNEIAKKFGGGGHIKASGCEIKGTIEDVHKIIVSEILKSFQTG